MTHFWERTYLPGLYSVLQLDSCSSLCFIFSDSVAPETLGEKDSERESPAPREDAGIEASGGGSPKPASQSSRPNTPAQVDSPR